MAMSDKRSCKNNRSRVSSGRISVILAKLLQNRDVFITAPVPDQRAIRDSRPDWALFKSNTRKQSTAGFAAAADVQSASIQRGNRSWTRVGSRLQKPAPLVDANLEKKRVKNALVKGIKTLARADEVALAL